jgi:hypothetical protein
VKAWQATRNFEETAGTGRKRARKRSTIFLGFTAVLLLNLNKIGREKDDLSGYTHCIFHLFCFVLRG